MAIMIPDRIPSTGNASKGEKRLFSILQDLPDDCIVYHENNCTGRYVDFIILSPTLGLLVIEVKGWYPKNILGGDSNEIKVSFKGKEKLEKHPLRQAREYMYKLKNLCEENSNLASACLVHSSGSHLGKTVFPLGHGVVLSNIKQDELIEHPLGDLTQVFQPENCIYRDELLAWESESTTAEELVEILRPYFQVQFEFPRLSTEQIETIRLIVHPEIKLPANPVALAKLSRNQSLAENSHSPIIPASVKVLDSKQELNAWNIGQGHRLLFGVAGSGKTIILTTRAKILSRHDQSASILLLCYNVTLSVYLQKLLLDYPNVNVKHFDGWSKENGVTRKISKVETEWITESDEDLGNRLLFALENGARDTERYDAILVDEAQDFHTTWFECVLEAMKDRLDGDLIIVGDGSQGIYANRKISWKQIGIQAQGRSISKRFDLDRNYRNAREIVELASLFVNTDEDSLSENTIASPQIDVQSCIRHAGVVPVLLESPNLTSECERVIELVKRLLAGSWFDKSIIPAIPSEIGILYPFAAGIEHNNYFPGRKVIRDLVLKLNRVAPTIWLSENSKSDHSSSRNRVCDPGVKVQTIHSAKGLQYRIVILLWGGLLPATFGQHTESGDKKLMYVALTRAEDLLLVSHSGQSKFIEQMKQWSGDAAYQPVDKVSK